MVNFVPSLIFIVILSCWNFMKVIHSAKANATHNHGMDSDRLLVGK